MRHKKGGPKVKYKKNRSKIRWSPLGVRSVSGKKKKGEMIVMKVKHRFCYLCRKWYPSGYGFVRHECCKSYPALKVVESSLDFIKQLKGNEFIEESRRIMIATQEKNIFKETGRK